MHVFNAMPPMIWRLSGIRPPTGCESLDYTLMMRAGHAHNLCGQQYIPKLFFAVLALLLRSSPAPITNGAGMGKRTMHAHWFKNAQSHHASHLNCAIFLWSVYMTYFLNKNLCRLRGPGYWALTVLALCPPLTYPIWETFCVRRFFFLRLVFHFTDYLSCVDITATDSRQYIRKYGFSCWNLVYMFLLLILRY